MTEEYTYILHYSKKDEGYIAISKEFPFHKVIDPSPHNALHRLLIRVEESYKRMTSEINYIPRPYYRYNHMTKQLEETIPTLERKAEQKLHRSLFPDVFPA